MLHPEWIKIRKYRTFWILTALYATTLMLLLFSLQGILDNFTVNVNNKSPLPIPSFPVYAFPGVWQNLAYIAGFLKMFPAFLVILLITNEFTYKTLKQQVITGSSRSAFVMAKVTLVVLTAMAVSLLVAITGLLAGLLQKMPDTGQIFTSRLLFIPAHMLELTTYMLFAAFLSVLLKRAGVTVMVFLLYAFILERILSFRLPDNISRFLPLEAAGNLVPLPNSALMKLFGVSFSEFTSMRDVIVCLGWSAVFILAIFLLIRKKDL